MFDIGDHGGQFGGRQKFISVNKTNLTDSEAVLVGIGFTSTTGKVFYYDDDYIWSFSVLTLFKHNRKTGALVYSKNSPTNYTLVDAIYSPDNNMCYLLAQYPDGRTYLLRTELEVAGAMIVQRYINYQSNGGGFVVTDNYVFLFAYGFGAWRLPKNFVGNNTEYTVINNTGFKNIGTCYFDVANNEIHIANGTTYWKVDAITLTLKKSINGVFYSGKDTSYLIDSEYKYVYCATSNQLFKKDISGATAQIIYQPSISDISGLASYHNLNFDSDNNVLIRGSGRVQKMDDTTGVVSNWLLFPQYYFYAGFYDLKNMFIDWFYPSGSSYLYRAYSKIQLK